MKKEERTAIVLRHLATTPGEWRFDEGRYCQNGPRPGSMMVQILVGDRAIVKLPEYEGPDTEAEEARCRSDYLFMACAHQDIPALMAEAARWRRRWAEDRAACVTDVPPEGGACRCSECVEAREILSESQA